MCHWESWKQNAGSLLSIQCFSHETWLLFSNWIPLRKKDTKHVCCTGRFSGIKRLAYNLVPSVPNLKLLINSYLCLKTCPYPQDERYRAGRVSVISIPFLVILLMGAAKQKCQALKSAALPCCLTSWWVQEKLQSWKMNGLLTPFSIYSQETTAFIVK